MTSKIKVLIVDDSALAREVLTQILEADPEIEVVATARNGQKAIELAKAIRPDVITMDLVMPNVDGLEAIRTIMAYCPTPIVVLSEYDFTTHSNLVFEALDAGALDVVNKPSLARWKQLQDECENLIKDIKVLAKVRVITHIAGKRRVVQKPAVIQRNVLKNNHSLVAIAASTGGPNALCVILSKLPKNFPAPILIVQHITHGFIRGLVSWLDGECKIDVKEAKQGMILEPSVAYICPTGYHLRVNQHNRIILDNKAAPVKGFRPSADILFESVGRNFHGKATGVILTGMGDDGTEGLKVLKASGGNIIAQDKESCVIFGMPSAAIKADVVDKICSLDLIAQEITKAINRR